MSQSPAPGTPASAPPTPPRAPRLRGSVLARAAVFVAGLTVVSQVLGFVRDAVIGAVYGVSPEVDAFLVAQSVLNLVLGLVASSVARSTVPTVARALEEGAPERGQRSARVALTVTNLGLLVASAGMFVAAPAVVEVLAGGFDPDTTALAVELTRIVLLATVLVASTNILAAVAQAHGRFVLAGLEGVPFNLVMIGAVLLGRQYGVTSLAWGFVLGSLARLIVQLPAIRAIRMRLAPSLAVRDPGFREIVALAPPMLVGAAVVNVNLLVVRSIASEDEGAIAALNFGFRLVNMADALFVAAFVTILYPAFGTLGSPERRAELRALTGRSVRAALVLLTPVVVGLVVAARPLVELAFGRGNFDDRAVALTATAVVSFAGIVVATGVRQLVARAFYAVGDSRTPVTLSVLGMLINVAGALTVGRAFGIAALAATTTVASMLVAVFMLVALHVRHRAYDARPTLGTLLRVGVAGLGAAAPTALVVARMPRLGLAGDVLVVAAAGAVCLLTYLLVLRLLREPTLADVAGLLRQGLTRRRRRADP